MYDQFACEVGIIWLDCGSWMGHFIFVSVRCGENCFIFQSLLNTFLLNFIIQLAWELRQDVDSTTS